MTEFNLVAVSDCKLAYVEQLYILSVFERYKGNRTHTAKSLGISIRTLQRKLESYGLEKGRPGQQSKEGVK